MDSWNRAIALSVISRLILLHLSRIPMFWCSWNCLSSPHSLLQHSATPFVHVLLLILKKKKKEYKKKKKEELS